MKDPPQEEEQHANGQGTARKDSRRANEGPPLPASDRGAAQKGQKQAQKKSRHFPAELLIMFTVCGLCIAFLRYYMKEEHPGEVSGGTSKYSAHRA